ncbi:hypothetical protein [Paenibacillus cremeus]|uniref:Uncharacterized protein n=1 Tax=Paenibacillus cremeus TaxID=2163881 RepID=A0A559K687_9BACL|nr:hypothetical protein [Paenibacillus cremeus]TVY07597.1 hypothetical protein FPZ49_22900 [Paenibacillus cremeus]
MKMPFSHKSDRRMKYPAIALVFTLIAMLLYNVVPGITYAGKEGVFLNNSVYFTLEEVALSKGTSSQTMQFRVMLNNDSDASVDFNQYGVQVVTTDGRAYYAQLSEKANAVVAGHSAQSFSFIAKVAPGLTADQLSVDFFNRGSGNQDMGALSVQKAMSFLQTDHQFVFNLTDADPTFTGNTFVSVQAVNAFAVPTDDQYKITLDTKVKVSGTDSWNPTSLAYVLKDGANHTFALKAANAESVQSDGVSTYRVLLTTMLDTQPDLQTLKLDMNKTDGTNLGTIDLQSLFTMVNVGDKASFNSQGREGVTLVVDKAEEMNQSGKRQALVTATLHNDGKRTVANPVLAGMLVSKDQQISLATETVVKDTDKYTSAGKTTSYQFVVELPDEVVSGAYEFYVSEQKSSTAVSSASSSSSSTSGTTGSTTGTSSSSQSSSQSGLTTTIPVMAVNLDAGLTASTGVAPSGSSYELGTPFVFKTDNKTIDPKLDVSLVEINAHTNPDNGYQTVVAKFKFMNNSQETLDLPTFDTELQDDTGTSYPGARQTTTLKQLIPQSAYVYSYAYLMPPTAKGTFKLSILEPTSSSLLKLPISAVQVAVHSTDDDAASVLGKMASFYPYTVNIQDWNLGSTYSGGTYSYKLKLSLDIKKDTTVLVDDSFSTMEFELVDSNGIVLGNSVQTLQGTNKLISGLQSINFSSVKAEQFDYPLTVNVYEDITTANGTAKRLIAKLQQ